MGLAILPSRLAYELKLLSTVLANKEDISKYPELQKHSQWAEQISQKYSSISSANAYDIVLKETGLVFTKVLEHAGVYKRTPQGIQAFDKFINQI